MPGDGVGRGPVQSAELAADFGRQLLRLDVGRDLRGSAVIVGRRMLGLRSTRTSRARSWCLGLQRAPRSPFAGAAAPVLAHSYPSSRITLRSSHQRIRGCAINLASVLDWDHNAYYHRLLLRQLPQRCHRVLDVGCGAGSFATRLASRVERVDAVDRSPAMIEVARQRTPDNVNCILVDVLSDPLPGDAYDAIFSISALHHMPLQVLAVIALPRMDLVRELPAEMLRR